VINLWHRKFITADVTAVFVNNQHGIKRWGQHFDKKFVFEGVHSKEVDRWISWESWTKCGVHKLFKKLWDTCTINSHTVPTLKKMLSYCRNFWSRSLAHCMRAAQFASVISCVRHLLKHFRCTSLQIIQDTEDRWIPISCDSSRTVLWVCRLFSWLRTKPLTVSTFSSVRAQIDGKSK